MTSLARLFAFVAASGLAHVSVGLVNVSPEPTRDRGAESVQVVDLDLIVDDGHSAPRERETEREEPQREERAARRPAERPTPRAADSELLVPAPPAPVPPAPPPARIDLSPLAAARSVVDVRAAPPPAPRAHDERAPGVSLDAMLRAAAAARPALTRRDDPQLAPKDGGYVFEGDAFDATIDGDGTVHFSDRYGELRLTVSPQVQPDGTVGLVFLRFAFDLTAWAEAMHGNDPYRSERRWFLERTAELRERLAREAFARALARADRQLKRDLARIWSGAGPSATGRARRTFELWDHMAEDEVGALARRQIEAHVRAQCPEPTACALDAPALERLNAGRRSRARFAPFAPAAP